jgi:hypothetical protein
MHGILTLWRLRPDENFEHLADRLSTRIAESEATLPGYVAGYAVRTGLDTMATFNVYESAIEAEVASHALALVVLEAMEGHAQVIERHSGPVHELRPLTRTAALGAGEP